MRAFIPYPAVTHGTNEILWYYENEHGGTVGPFESKEHAGAASKAAYTEYRNSRNPPDGGSGPGM